MSHQRTDLHPVEEALWELDEAVAAGVFHRTSPNGRSLLTRTTFRFARAMTIRVACAAAAVGLAVGLWAWLPRASVPWAGGPGSGTLAHVPTTLSGGFHDCFGGPTEVIRSACRTHDYDADGDVDLVDFGAYQLTYASADY